MILAEYDRPLLEIPAISSQAGSNISFGQPPYSEYLNGDWRYGDSADSVVAGDRLRNFMIRTGKQIYQKVLPFDNIEENDLCGVCHELGVCPRTNTCSKSEGNRNCGHPDNAVVYPGLESLLTVLFIGGIITPEDFAHHSAYLRVLAGKFSQIDLMARWPKVTSTQEDPINLPTTFIDVFGIQPTPEDMADTIQQKIIRNKRWQKTLRVKADEYVPIVCEKIRLGLKMDWSPKMDQLCRKTTNRIEGLIPDMLSGFWQMSYPA